LPAIEFVVVIGYPEKMAVRLIVVAAFSRPEEHLYSIFYFSQCGFVF
jgi:hypothetical protein